MSYSYWQYEKELNTDQIKRIFNCFDSFQNGTVNKGDVDSKIRVTDVAWSREKELYELFFPYLDRANQQAGWHFEIDACENFQLGRYKEGQGHYDWHIDGDGHNKIDSNATLLKDKVRKISMVLWLNDNFEGGDFELHKSVCEEGRIKPTKGTLIFFPSYYLHKVHKVTKGTRYSLVTWFVGNRFL